MNYVNMITNNLILLLSFFAWAVAQILKVIIQLITTRELNIRRLLQSGGMPSSHAACVCACATSVGQLYGIASPLFAIAAVMALIVMYDACNVRRSAGEQAKILNFMMKNWEQGKPDFFTKNLKEFLGHTPLQVLMGAILGIAIGYFGVALFG